MKGVEGKGKDEELRVVFPHVIVIAPEHELDIDFRRS